MRCCGGLNRMNSVLLEEKETMSKDMLGSLWRAGVNVPQDHLETLAKLASMLSIDSPKDRPLGRVWHAYLKKITKERLPDSAYLIEAKPTVVDLGEYEVDYDETVKEKLQSDKARPKLDSWEFTRYMDALYRGIFVPSETKGKVRYKASVVSFNVALSNQAVKEWCRQNRKVAAGMKEGIDIALTLPLLALGPVLPLLMFGECRWDRFEFMHTPCLRLSDGKDKISLVWERSVSETIWDKGWKFLVVEEVKLQGS